MKLFGKNLVRSVRAVAASLGEYGKFRMPAEVASLAAMRKGIIAAQDLEAGTVLHQQDLMFARPATEFGSGELSDVVGKKLTKKLAQGELIPRDSVTAV